LAADCDPIIPGALLRDVLHFDQLEMESGGICKKFADCSKKSRFAVYSGRSFPAGIVYQARGSAHLLAAASLRISFSLSLEEGATERQRDSDFD
jgi:hypothetical protein